MLPERFFIGQPVRSLQQMLREISYAYPFMPGIIPDGIYEQETARSVTLFQQNFNLPPTGITDSKTWEAIVAVFRQVVAASAPPLHASLFPGAQYAAAPGEQTLYLVSIQAMFKALARMLDGLKDLETDGKHIGPSVHNVRWLQHRCGMEENGIVDMEVWNHLTRLYALFITKNPKLR